MRLSLQGIAVAVLALAGASSPVFGQSRTYSITVVESPQSSKDLKIPEVTSPNFFTATLDGARKAKIKGEGTYSCFRSGHDYFVLSDGVGSRANGLYIIIPTMTRTGRQAIATNPAPAERGVQIEARGEFAPATGYFDKNVDGWIELLELDRENAKGSFDFTVQNDAQETVKVQGSFAHTGECLRR